MLGITLNSVTVAGPSQPRKVQVLSHHHTALEAQAHTIRWALNKIRDVNGGKEKINLPLLVYDDRMSRISREPMDLTKVTSLT